MLIERTLTNEWTVALYFVFLLAFYAIIRTTSSSKSFALFESYFSSISFNQHFKEEYFIKNYPSFFLVLISALNNGLILFYIYYKTEPNKIFYLFLVIVFALVLKVFFSYFISKTISSRGVVVKEYYTLEVLNFQMIGLVSSLLIPLLIIIDAEFVKQIYFSTLALCFVYKLIKQIHASISHNTSWFYIILYFCAFEIIPVLTLVKITGRF